MKCSLLKTLFIFLILIVCSISISKTHAAEVYVKDGVLDLTHINFDEEKHKNAKLNIYGEWSFYPNQLIKNISEAKGERIKINVNEKFPEIDSNYGTFYFKILLMPKMKSLILEINESCNKRIYINNYLKNETGRVSNNAKMSKCGFGHRSIILLEDVSLANNSMEILIQFSNFSLPNNKIPLDLVRIIKSSYPLRFSLHSRGFYQFSILFVLAIIYIIWYLYHPSQKILLIGIVIPFVKSMAYFLTTLFLIGSSYFMSNGMEVNYSYVSVFANRLHYLVVPIYGIFFYLFFHNILSKYKFLRYSVCFVVILDLLLLFFIEDRSLVTVGIPLVLLFSVILIIICSIFIYLNKMDLKKGSLSLLFIIFIAFLYYLSYAKVLTNLEFYFPMLSVLNTYIDLLLASSVFSLPLAIINNHIFESDKKLTLELEKTQKEINEINDNFYTIVKERTMDLYLSFFNIKRLLDRINSAIFTINNKLQIDKNYSAHTPQIFHLGLENIKDIFTHCKEISVDTKELIMTSFRSFFGMEDIAFELNKHNLPAQIQYEAKIIEMDWVPILDENKSIDKILTVGTDITEKQKKDWEAKKLQEEYVCSFHIAEMGVKKISDFLDSVQKMLDENKNIIQKSELNKENLQTLFRNMHTIKGNARMCELPKIVETAHIAEDGYEKILKGVVNIDSTSLIHEQSKVEESINFYKNLIESVFKIDSKKKRKQDGRLTRFIQQIKQLENNFDLSTLKTMREAFQYFSISDAFVDEIESLPDMALKLGKMPPLVTIIDNGCFIHQSLIQILKDVMIHLLRNSMDHGLETALDRKAAQKNERGTIFIVANPGVLKVYDDGKGLNLGVLEKKLHNGSKQFEDLEIAMSIFQSGMSTATTVTDISGRGVGMDAVKSFVEEKGGKIEIEFLAQRNQDNFRPFSLNIIFSENKIKQF